MLAELAAGAGYRVVAVDYFGDSDLRRLCQSVSLLRDLEGRGGLPALVAAARRLGAPTVAYTSSFENHPQLVTRLAKGRSLLGNPAAVLERVRRPELLAASLREAGLPFPETIAGEAADQVDASRTWLRKPVLSGGGHAVRVWDGGPLPRGSVLQEMVQGLPCSAAFVAGGGGAVLLGLTEQLIGWSSMGGRGFRWCGSLVPPRLPRGQVVALLHQARAIGDRLAGAFGLRGLFGVDAIWDGERAWTLEVNPRPSASLEAIQRAYGLQVFDAHVRAQAGELPSFDLESAWEVAPAAGKAIVFATEDVGVGDTQGWPERGIRDVPHPGERIAVRHPICTLLASEVTPEACLRSLEAQAMRLRTELKSPVAA